MSELTRRGEGGPDVPKASQDVSTEQTFDEIKAEYASLEKRMATIFGDVHGAQTEQLGKVLENLMKENEFLDGELMDRMNNSKGSEEEKSALRATHGHMCMFVSRILRVLTERMRSDKLGITTE